MNRHVVALGVALITFSTGGTAAASAPAADPSKPDLRSALWRAGSAGEGTGYSLSDGSRRVRELQRALRSLGYGAGPVDGLFGPRTEAAVRHFQAKHGLRVDGRAGRATRVELSRSIGAHPRSPAARAQRASRSSTGRAIDLWKPALSRGAGYSRPNGAARVRRLQADLARLRHSPGRVDGLFGPKTELAVRRFQRRHGLKRDGIVGPKALAQLARSTSARDTTSDSTAPPDGRAAGDPGQPPGAIRQPDPANRLPVPIELVALVGGLLALLALAVVAARRRGRSGHLPGIEHTHNLYVEGRGERVGAFAGFVIVFGHARRDDGSAERTCLVDDPSREKPVWVRESELERTSLGSGRKAGQGGPVPSVRSQSDSRRPDNGEAGQPTRAKHPEPERRSEREERLSRGT